MIDPGKVYLISGDKLAELQKSSDEWRNLVVLMTGGDTAKLTRAPGQSILEIPRPRPEGEKNPDFPFRSVLDADGIPGKVSVFKGGIQVRAVDDDATDGSGDMLFAQVESAEFLGATIGDAVILTLTFDESGAPAGALSVIEEVDFVAHRPGRGAAWKVASIVADDDTGAPVLVQHITSDVLFSPPVIGPAHPFKIIDASDDEGLKVRVLPGLCNFAWATVNGVANNLTDPAAHAEDAPRINIPGTGYVALVFAGATPGSPYPASVDIQYSASMGSGTLPLAKVTVSGGRITQIYQTVFDVVGVAALNYGGADDPIFMLTR